MCEIEEKYGRCCCTCKHHIEDYSHPTTDGKSCTDERGWICLAPDPDSESGYHAFSGWPEHGVGCEYYVEKGLKNEK